MIIIYFKDSYLIPYENCRFLFGQLSETIEKKKSKKFIMDVWKKNSSLQILQLQLQLQLKDIVSKKYKFFKKICPRYLGNLTVFRTLSVTINFVKAALLK